MARRQRGRCAVRRVIGLAARSPPCYDAGSFGRHVDVRRRRLTPAARPLRMTYLGVDLGTSALKAVLVDDAQAVLAEAAVPLRTSAPRPGWSEQNPEDWWGALQQAVARLRADQAGRIPRRPGLGHVRPDARAPCWSIAPAPSIRPAILWNDGRATRECADLLAAVPDLARIAGVIAMPGLTAPKLLWLKANEPETFAPHLEISLRQGLSAAAADRRRDHRHVRCRRHALAGRGARATGRTRSLRRPASRGPRCRASSRAARRPASCSHSVRAEWGIDGPVVLAGGAGDVAAAAIGIGAVEDGDAFVSLGTSAQFFVTDDATARSRRRCCTPSRMRCPAAGSAWRRC